MPTQTKENYLKSMYSLHQTHELITLTELSKAMSVNTSTANNMVKKLQTEGWVIYEKYKPLKLTPKGKKKAAIIVRKHRLAEMFLFQIMGFGWEEVHNIAEQIEHIDSDGFFDKMDKLLGYPTTDPHGSPIPDRQGRVLPQDYQRLSHTEIGDVVCLCALRDSSDELLVFLNSKGIQLEMFIKVIYIEPFDGSMQISCDDRLPITLSRQVCERLLVGRLDVDD